MFETKLRINAEVTDASSCTTFDRYSPVSGDVVTRAAAATSSDVQRAANSAAAAFPKWSETGPSRRRELLLAAAKVLSTRQDEVVEAMAAEIGATAVWAKFNIDLAGDILRDAAGLTTQITGSVIPTDRPGTLSIGLRQPVGVCLGMAPWNAPVILGFRAITMPLACGNTVVLKASELCPKTHCLIGDVLNDAGFPSGAVNVITNAPSDAERLVEELIAHPAVRRVNFTGSTRVGRKVAEASARYLKKCLLELGGKAPFIVLDDADVDAAVEAAAFGAFLNQGQICISTERIIVLDDIADEFVERFTRKARLLLASDPASGESVLGAVISAEAAIRLNKLVEDAEEKGAQILAGGVASGIFMNATVVDGVTPAMRIYKEECFGPIATIVRVSSIDEAVTVANDSDYGLAAAVFGRDVARAMAVGKRIESGICHVNSATVADEPQAPFGGVKHSGYGRFGGLSAIEEFTELRWITVGEASEHYQL